MNINNVIDSKNISVVIQGPTLYDENTFSLFHQCIRSINTFLPHAEIIVSTWQGQPCNENMVNTIIYNEEPEVITCLMGKTWNFNKMLQSTVNGLKKANRKYTLKFRADLCLTGTDLFIQPSLSEVNSKFQQYYLTEQPIIVTNLYIRNPASQAHLLFHPSDIVQFGLTKDLLDLWNIDPLEKEQVVIPLKWWSGFHYPYCTGERLVPEQALMTGWLGKKNYKINLPYAGFISSEYCKLSEILLSANFHIVDWRNSGVLFPKRFTDNEKMLNKTLYNAIFANQLISKYNEPNFYRKRLVKIIWHVYILKFFSLDAWMFFVASFIFWLSPSWFFSTRSFWRRFKF